MELVYFGQELNKKAPDLIGCMCTSPDVVWVDFFAVVNALDKGASISIRPASATEMKRAESFVALRDIGTQLGNSLGTLLDQQEPAVAMGVWTEIRDAFETATDETRTPFELLDKTQAPSHTITGAT